MISNAEHDAPPSPTLSYDSFASSSWHLKSPSELIPILKTTYSTLKDKEKDLRMAAHLGKSLLENNMALKSSYDELLQNVPYPTPTHSASLINLHDNDSDDEDCLKYIAPASTREALVEMLEQQNAKLEKQLENVLSNHEDLDRSHLSKTKQLENEISHLKQCLELATDTIHGMEENRNQQKTLTKNSITANCCTDSDENMKQLRSDYDHLSESKAQIENRLNDAVNKLGELRQQYQITTQDHESLQIAFENQSKQVDDLKATLEEYRVTLSQLKEREIYSSSYTIASSDASSLLTDDYYTRNNTSLLTELNMASNKSYGDTMFQICQPSNVDSTIESICNKADMVNSDDILDDALSLIGKLETEYDHNRFLQEKRHLCYNLDFENKEKEKELNEIEPLHYPSLEKYQILSPVDTQQQHRSMSVTEICRRIVESIAHLLRFSLILILASFFSIRRGPKSLEKQDRTFKK